MRLNEITRTRKDDISVFLINEREARPADGWQTPQNLYEDVIHDPPAAMDRRAGIGHAWSPGIRDQLAATAG